MTEPEFWNLIATTRGGEAQAHAERLTAAVAKLPVPEILSFGHWWYTFHVRAYSWPLWGAAYLMNGGCSDDGFIDFRSWLLLQGEAVYTNALANPDSLAAVPVEPDEAGCECYPPVRAYAQATGQDADVFYDALEQQYGPRLQTDEPGGESWDFDDDEEMQARLPNLHRKFGDA